MIKSKQAFLFFGVATALKCLSPYYPYPDWPSLNASVGGRLQQNVPMALPCFSRYNGAPSTFDEAACSRIRLDYTSSALRADTAGVATNPQGEICLSSPENQCLLDSSSTSPAPLPASNSSCNQGNMPPYVLTVQDASDVIAAFGFARSHRIALSVKNSGHDYMMRNMQRHSLMLWMRHVQHMTYHDTFTPDGCVVDDDSHGPVMTVGTGVSSDAATACRHLGRGRAGVDRAAGEDGLGLGPRGLGWARWWHVSHACEPASPFREWE